MKMVHDGPSLWGNLRLILVLSGAVLGPSLALLDHFWHRLCSFLRLLDVSWAAFGGLSAALEASLLKPFGPRGGKTATKWPKTATK